MPPFIRFIVSRLISIPITLLVITALLYGFVMLTPPEVRATLYLSAGADPLRLTEAQIQKLIDMIIKDHHLQEPYPVQYVYWLGNLVRGDWGYSPVLRDNVLDALIRRTPVTAELTLYSMLLFIPLGLISGVMAGSNKNRGPDHGFRLAAFTATSLPTFILALVLLVIFYVGLHWFMPDRLSTSVSMLVNSEEFHIITGFMTIDGILNGRMDVSLDALRHLVLPVITLSLLHWATLGRVTRAAMIEELKKDYILAGKAHGVSEYAIVWKHALRNALTPALTSSMLSAASLVTGVFVVEVIYNFKGISGVVVGATRDVPDAPTVLGFALYSVIVVLVLMLVLDIIQAIFDPRVREGIMNG